MTHIRYIREGRVYRSSQLVCPTPGVYEISEAKAQQVLRDFPQWFERVENQVDAPPSEPTDNQLEQAGGEDAPEQEPASSQAEQAGGEDAPEEEVAAHQPNLREMKRGELEAHAEAIGMEGPFDQSVYPNMEALIAAIETYQGSTE